MVPAYMLEKLFFDLLPERANATLVVPRYPCRNLASWLYQASARTLSGPCYRSVDWGPVASSSR